MKQFVRCKPGLIKKNVNDIFGHRLQNESRECDFHAKEEKLI
jgi:hypothetical protein